MEQECRNHVGCCWRSRHQCRRSLVTCRARLKPLSWQSVDIWSRHRRGTVDNSWESRIKESNAASHIESDGKFWAIDVLTIRPVRSWKFRLFGGASSELDIHLVLWYRRDSRGLPALVSRDVKSTSQYSRGLHRHLACKRSHTLIPCVKRASFVVPLGGHLVRSLGDCSYDMGIVKATLPVPSSAPYSVSPPTTSLSSKPLPPASPASSQTCLPV